MMLGILRYDSALGAGPMQNASSAIFTCSDDRSASEYTATVRMPSSRHARITRTAISPRLATSTLRNIRVDASGARGGVDDEQRLSVLDGGGVVDEDPGDPAVDLGLDLVEQ